MTSRARRPFVVLLASLVIVAGGAYLGAGLRIVLSGDAYPASQIAIITIGGTLALIAGVLLLRRALSTNTPAPEPAPGPTAAN